MEVDSPIASVFHCFEDFLRKVGTMNVFETLVYNYRLKEEFLSQVRVEDFSAILSELIQNLTILRHEMDRVKALVKVEELKHTVATNNDGQHLQIQQQHPQETAIFTATSAAEALNELQLRQACSNSNPLENNFANMIMLDNATYLHVIQAEDVKNMQNVNVVVGQVEDLQTLLSVKGFLDQSSGQQNGLHTIPVTSVQHHIPVQATIESLQNNGEEKMEHNSEPGPPNNSELFMIPILKQVVKSEDELSLNNICSMLGTGSDTSTHGEETQVAHQSPTRNFQAPAPKPKKKKVYSRTVANQQQTTTATIATTSVENDNDESLMFYCCDKCFHSFRTEERFSVHKCTAKGGGRNSTLIKDNSGLRKMKKFVCGLCLEEYRNLDRISFHLKRCEGGPFTCEMCPASAPQFSTMKSLNFHKIHEHKEERSFICKDCGFPFKFKCSLQKHKLRAHNTELQPRTFPCDLCPSVFMKKIFLTNHKVKSHNLEKEFACQICGQSYTSQQSLKTHTDEAHDETNKFSCDQCDKVFTKKEQLDLHMTVHSGSSNSNKAHLCETCGKSFSKKSKLDDHFGRRHAVGSQTFPCQSANCSKTFKTRKDQRQHFRRMHNGEQPVNDGTANETGENRVKKKKKDKKKKDSSAASASVSSTPAQSNHDSSSSESQEANGNTSKQAGPSNSMNNHSTSNSEMSSQGADENQLMSDFMEALTPGQLEQIIQADFLVPTLIP